MDFAWDVDREGDVSLVRCRVCNDAAVPRRVRIESRLDAPVLPPRRGGVPEAGWDESGVTLRLAPGDGRALGFAARAPPTDPPVEIAAVETVDRTAEAGGADSGERDEAAASATASALQRLGDHRPPRDAVAGGGADPNPEDPNPEDPSAPAAEGGAESDPDPDSPASPSAEATGWLDAVEKRLHAVESRVQRAERLTDADLATATAAVEDAGGVEAVAGLDERVAADADRLRELSERASALAARAEATDTPTEALEALS